MLLLLPRSRLSAAAQAQDPTSCRATLCYAESLEPFLARLEEARPDAGAPVHIIQIGDSHTAGDMITSGWRTRLQARYGNGGRGVLAAGRPYPGYLTWGVTASQSAGWSVNATFGARYQEGGAPLGISGFTQTARAAGETLGVTADAPEQNFDRVIVCAIAQPAAARSGCSMGASGGAPGRSTRRAARRHAATMETATPVGAASLVTTEDAGTVSDHLLRAPSGGGAASSSPISAWSAPSSPISAAPATRVVRAELAAYRPDLIVLAFGTNEGFVAEPQRRRLSKRRCAARSRASGGWPAATCRSCCSARPTPAAAAGVAGRPRRRLRRRLVGAAPARRGARRGSWRSPATCGAAFWNWSAAMGGRCAVLAAGALTEQMRGDHVHFTRDGGDRIGGADRRRSRPRAAAIRASPRRLRPAAGALRCCSRP